MPNQRTRTPTMANAIAVSKRDIGGMRTFSRFETLHYAQAQPPRKFVAKFRDLPCGLCPLYPRKRTSELSRGMSASRQKRTSVEVFFAAIFGAPVWIPGPEASLYPALASPFPD